MPQQRLITAAQTIASEWQEMQTHGSVRCWEGLALNTLIDLQADLLGQPEGDSLNPVTYICGYTTQPVLGFIPVLDQSKDEHRELVRQALLECRGTGLILGAVGYTMTLDKVTREPVDSGHRVVFVSVFHVSYPHRHSKIVSCDVYTEHGLVTGFSLAKWEEPQPDSGGVADCFWGVREMLAQANARAN